jgi:cytochrome c-type biogenesis protein CcmE
MNNRNVILLAVIAVSAIITVKYMVQSVVPYIPLREAKSKPGYIQIMGTLDKKTGVTKNGGTTVFVLNDATGSITVSCTDKGMPDITQAERIAVMGSFDRERNLFTADKVLTKCPTKYQPKK